MQKTKRNKLDKKKIITKKKLAKKMAIPEKVGGHNRLQWKSQSVDAVEFTLEELEVASNELSGDLQGLSKIECADSESVDELLEEGNAFEAEVVMGVENAEDADETEVYTHEVPQDDVPAEYQDEES